VVGQEPGFVHGLQRHWEVLGAKFHSKRSYLRQLNSGDVQVGTVLKVPNVAPSASVSAASVRISLSGHWIEALDGEGKPLAHFPCSIAKDKDKRPAGSLFVQVIAPHPNYTFDPKLFPDAAEREGITHKLIIPPGPKNPVGSMWIGLSLPTYGIHGTPEPEAIARTGSHGCFRLADWNAEALARMVRVGTPVDVEP
jgi:lipoprotein-anchoring transpeptidase ErfK/SrfK